MSQLRKVIIGIVAAVVVAFGVWRHQALTHEPASDKPVIKIGVSYPLSGDAAVFGQAAKNAAKIFFDEFNKQERAFDYKVIWEDNQSKLAIHARAAKKLIAVNKVDVIFTFMSNFGAVVSPMAEESKVLHVSAATDPLVGKGDYNFLMSSNVEAETSLLYDTLLKKGAREVEIVVANISGAISMLDYFQKIVNEKKGIQINKVHYVNPDERDMRIMLMKIKRDKPDYIISLLFAPAIDIFLRQYHDAGMTIPVTGVETLSYLQNKALAEGMWYVDVAGATDAYAEKYLSKTGLKTTDYAEYMDVMLQAVTTAYENAKTTDKLKVGAEIIAGMRGAATAVGPVTVDAEGIINTTAILRKITNGKAVITEEE